MQHRSLHILISPIGRMYVVILSYRIPRRTPDSCFAIGTPYVVSDTVTPVRHFPSLFLSTKLHCYIENNFTLERTSTMTSNQKGKPFPQPAVGSTHPFWRTAPDPLDDHQTPLPTETDVLIIGGGYVGASAAYRLVVENKQEIPPRVTLVEARGLCSGATGRNGEPRPNTR